MNDKRYSVFISSTFEDLKQERQAVQDVLISAGDFPVQMESFPAADEDQFSFIKTLIDKCDYYILIVAGRYGSPADDGMSYTEKEYHYAVSMGIAVLAMLHGDRGSIPVNKSETTDEGKKLLDEFLKKIEKNRIRKSWTTKDALKLAVREALDNAKATKRGIGWVRGDIIASVEALEELNEVRKENLKFRDAIGSPQIEFNMPPIPAAHDDVEIDLLPMSINSNGFRTTGSAAKLRCTWISAFPVFFSNLKCQWGDWGGDSRYYVEEEKSCQAIGAAFAGELASFETQNLFKISKTTFDRLSSYYIEVGLMMAEGENPFTEAAQRLTRRQRISGSMGGGIDIIKGDVNLTSSSTGRSDLDDEIPF